MMSSQCLAGLLSNVYVICLQDCYQMSSQCLQDCYQMSSTHVFRIVIKNSSQCLQDCYQMSSQCLQDCYQMSSQCRQVSAQKFIFTGAALS